MWGYDRDVYAADLLTYLQEHYYDLGASLRIRNEYLNEAIRRMIEAGYEGYLTFEDPIPLTSGETAAYQAPGPEGARVSVIPSERIQLELVEFIPRFTPDQECGNLVITVQNVNTGEEIGSAVATGKYMVSDTMNLVYLPSCVLEAGEEYVITIQADGGTVPELAVGYGINENPDERIAVKKTENEIWRVSLSITEPYEEYYDEYSDYDWEGEWDEGV